MDEADLRSIVRLLGDARLLHAGHAGKKHLVLSRLCRLVQADSWRLTIRVRESGRKIEDMAGSVDEDAAPEQPSRSRANRRWGLRLSANQIAEGVVSGITLARAPGRAPFTAREAKLAAMVLNETAWLHEEAGRRAKPATLLTPRQQATLVCLTEGLSRQEIAQRLAISPHTVHDYIRVIFRRYGVRSRAELTRRVAVAATPRRAR